MMMVMRLDIDLAALAAFDDGAMRVMMRDIHQQLRLAAAAAIGFIPASLAQRLSGDMRLDFGAGGVFGIDD